MINLKKHFVVLHYFQKLSSRDDLGEWWRKGQLILKCFFWCLPFLPKNERNNSTWGIIVVKSNSFFRRIVGLKKSLRLCLTFSIMCNKSEMLLQKTVSPHVVYGISTVGSHDTISIFANDWSHFVCQFLTPIVSSKLYIPSNINTD